MFRIQSVLSWFLFSSISYLPPSVGNWQLLSKKAVYDLDRLFFKVVALHLRHSHIIGLRHPYSNNADICRIDFNDQKSDITSLHRRITGNNSFM